MKKIKYELNPDTLEYLPVKQTNYLPSIHIKKPSNGFLGLGCLAMVCLLNFLYFRPAPTGDLRVTCVTAGMEKKLLVSREAEEEKHEEITKTPLENIPDIDVSDIEDAKKKAYIKRFYKVAILEQQKYQIPASITLGQGILESTSGTSELATKANNHFGIKSFKKTEKKYAARDDKWITPKGKVYHGVHPPKGSKKVCSDFRAFDRAWAAIRAHSELLMNTRYTKHVSNRKSFVSWAKGLKKGGYATDPTYDTALINLIKKLKLNRFDNVTP